MKRALKVLIVEGWGDGRNASSPPAESRLPASARLELERDGFVPQFFLATSETDFLARLQAEVDIVLWHAPATTSEQPDGDFSATQALNQAVKVLRARRPSPPLLVIGAATSQDGSGEMGAPTYEETITQWMRLGAADFVREDRLDRMGALVRRALNEQLMRRRDEMAFKASGWDRRDTKFRALIENALDLIMVVDQQARILYSSPSCERVLGYKSETSLGRNALVFVHPDDAEKMMAAFDPIISIPDATIETEFRFLHADGSWHTIEIIAKNLLHEPSIGGLVLNGRDVTDRKRMDDELRFRVEFENIIAHISTQFLHLQSTEVDAGIDAVLQTAGEFLKADRAYVFQLDRFRLGEVPDTLLCEVKDCISNTHEWCAAAIAPYRDELQNIPLTQFPWLIEHLHRFEAVYVPRVLDLPVEASAEKEEFVREGIRSLIIVPMISRGTLVGFLGFDAVRAESSWSDEVVSLTRILGEILAHGLERRHAEGALRESEQRYRTIVETSPDAISLFDLGGKLVVCNPQKAAMHGYEHPEQLVGRSAYEFLAREEHSRATSDMYKVAQNGILRDEEYTLVRRDGSPFVVELSASLITDDIGQPRAIAVVSRDIASRKLAEAQIQRQLNQIMALRNIDMAITASHDLRLTLNVILDQVLSQLQVDAACVLLLNPHSGILEYANGRGFMTDALKHTRLRMGEGYAGRAALERRTVSVPAGGPNPAQCAAPAARAIAKKTVVDAARIASPSRLALQTLRR